MINKRPVSSPDYQYKTYKKMLTFFNDNTDAKIVFISCPSFYFPIQKKRTEKMRKLNKNHNLFGMDEHIVNFNNTLKKLAAEEGIDYIDIYEITKNDPEKVKLFVSGDGIHLSMLGQQLVANAILNYLKRISNLK